MNPRTTGWLLLAVLGLGAFVYFYELEGESARLEAEERTKRLFPDLEAEDVAWIEMRTSDGVDARFEREEGAWQMVAPRVYPADSAVDRMADALAGLTHEAVFDDPQPDAEYGLDDASARIVRFGEADDTEHVLHLGRDTPVGSNVYAKTGAGASVYTVAGYRKAVFERTLADLRDKQILDFDATAIVRVEARWPSGRVVLERAAPSGAEEGGEVEEVADDAPPGSEWRMEAPVAAPGDDAAIDRLLSTLAFLRADDFLDVPGDAETALLDPPDFAVSLRTKDAEAEPVALAVGRAGPDDRRPVRAGDGRHFWLGADRIQDFPRDVVAYRDRTLARVDLERVRQLDFFFQSKTGDPTVIRAVRDEDGWSSTPEAFAEGQLSRIVSELAHLEAEDVLAESMGEAELEAVGLSPPNAILLALGATPEGDAAEDAQTLPPEAPILAEVHFGEVTADGVVARSAGRDTIYRLAIEIAENLPVSLEGFRNRFRAEPGGDEPVLPPAEAGAGLLDPGEESP